MTNILIKFILIFLILTGTFAQKNKENFFANKDKILDDITTDHNESYDIKSIKLKTNTGVDTKIYGYWDYQSNGGAINYIDINLSQPENIHVISMISTDSIDPVSVSMSRRVVYNFSNDGGTTWGSPITVPNFRAGYPSLIIASDQTENSFCVIASHSVLNGYLRSSIYVDEYEGAGNFFTYETPLFQYGTDNPVFPVITQTSNGNILLAASFPATSSIGGIAVITFNLSNRSWSNWIHLEPSPQHAGRLAIASGDNGYAAVIWRSNTNPDSLLYRQTTNNGLTWGAKTVIDFETENITPCWTGFDAIYNGTDLYIVFTRTGKNASGLVLANEVCFWNSSNKNTVTIIDSTRYPYMMKSTGTLNIQTNHNFAFNFPSIGYNANKTRIYVCVDVFLQGETDPDGFNYSDILVSYSDDLGVSWSFPRNVTKTKNLDERYVSVSSFSPWINDSNYVFMLIQEDKIPGANYATNSREARQISGAKTRLIKFNTDYIETGNSAINVNANWNMVSIPVDTIVDKNSFFLSAASNAFTMSEGGTYVAVNQLVPGKGYWIKFRNPEIYNISGKKLDFLKIAVKSGWNMIGCYSEEISVSNITTTPPNIIVSKFYEYSGGYIQSSILKPGKAYWVKVKTDGYLNLISK